MPVFPLKLHKTYLEQGFFNITVAFDKYVRQTEGPINLVLSLDGREQSVAGKVNRSANQNGTARIMGGKNLRELFLTHFDVGTKLDVDLGSQDEIRISKVGDMLSDSRDVVSRATPAIVLPGRPADLTSPKRRRIEGRIASLIEGFEGYVAAYDADVPFRRDGQYELHRATIERRRMFPTVGATLADDEFVRLLHDTLQSWGIGRRASVLLPIERFSDALRTHRDAIAQLDWLALEGLTDNVSVVGDQVWRCIEEIRIVENVARIVPGTKLLHHLLPDLVPPMDRMWTGRFFEWGPFDLQNRQSFLAAWRDLAHIARTCQPSRLVGPGWRTSATKVLDNAIVAFGAR
jgi:hypothetical protein